MSAEPAPDCTFLSSEDDLALLFRSTPMATYVTDGAGRVVLWNPAAEKLFGWSEEEVLGKRDPTLDPAATDTSVVAIMMGQEIVDRLTRRVAKGSRSLDVVLSAARFEDKAGVTRGVVTMACDGSPRVQDRRARDRLLAVVSHDLRNSLATVLLNASAVIESPAAGEVDPATRDQLRWIARSAEQMNRLIADLLDASAIELGRLSHAPARQHVGKIVHDAKGTHLPLALERGIDLTSAVEPGLPDVFVDGGRIQQVLGNLLGNALKFTPAGGSVCLLAGPDSRGWVRFRVSDTGPGIDPRHLPAIFDLYWQAERSNVPRSGAGLGLSIAQAIVKRHGGRIWVRSAPGRGSTFSFTVPAAGQTG
jgi:PAS domain S-box-containing protein